MKKYLLLIASFILTLQIKAQTVSDVDGNTYNTVTIGTQIWMKENLKTTKYNDGVAIPNVTDNAAWSALSTPAYCWYGNNAATYKATYGAMYNGYTVNTGKLCPSGWHVPTMTEWLTLVDFLGGHNVAGGKMKESGTVHWQTPNPTSNSCGFNALPGGFRRHGDFFGLGLVINWWGIDNNTLDTRYVQFDVIYSEIGGGSISDGYYVRCLKDTNTTTVNIAVNSVDKIIYPNPATDKLFIKNIKSSDATIAIFDIQGKQVISRKIDSNPIDISSLSKGIYLVKVIDSGNIIMEKLVKK